MSACIRRISGPMSPAMAPGMPHDQRSTCENTDHRAEREDEPVQEPLCKMTHVRSTAPA